MPSRKGLRDLDLTSFDKALILALATAMRLLAAFRSSWNTCEMSSRPSQLKLKQNVAANGRTPSKF